jgi:polyisoprenoid-binding protein YceI
MKKIIILLAIVAAQTSVFAQGTWTVDKMHSSLKFTVTHLSVSDVDGVFSDFDATITTTKADFSDAKFTLTAKVASINTGVGMRDDDLKSDHFFNAAANPTLTFVSTDLTPTKPNHFKLSGNLTMHGVTKAVVFDLWYRGTIVNPMSKTNDAGFQITGTVNRVDFGIASGYPDSMISTDVVIKADGEFKPVK